MCFTSFDGDTRTSDLYFYFEWLIGFSHESLFMNKLFTCCYSSIGNGEEKLEREEEEGAWKA